MKKPTWQRWAEFRFGVVGPLLAAPPSEHGDLKSQIDELAAKTWSHPTTGQPAKFASSTIEGWYYQAKRHAGGDTVKSLARKRRRDAGKTVIAPALAEALTAQYRQHRSWSVKLHSDNLRVKAEEGSELGSCPSYQTLRRFMRAKGLVKMKKRRGQDRTGAQAALDRLDHLETRSYEVEYVGGLLHLDFHKGRLRVVTEGGERVTPICLAVIDDHSRLICHVQWYLTETTRDLVHGFSQALMRRGLPRALLTDNGAAMTAAEFTSGLARLGIVHDTTLAYSPHQNGKIENFWGRLEGRLVAMLEGVKAPTIALLNEATLAWVEMEYHREVHGETGETPVQRFSSGKSVLRPSPTAQRLGDVFRADEKRKQRRGDGTVLVEGVRFEVPSRLRHLLDVTVRYARWDLTHIDVVDEKTGDVLAPLYLLDKARNADGHRRRHADCDEVPSSAPTGEVAPLLKKYMTERTATGLPPPYLPQLNT